MVYAVGWMGKRYRWNEQRQYRTDPNEIVERFQLLFLVETLLNYITQGLHVRGREFPVAGVGQNTSRVTVQEWFSRLTLENSAIVERHFNLGRFKGGSRLNCNPPDRAT